MNIQKLAKEAAHPYQPPIAGKWQEQWLERFAALVAAHEREACAKVCDIKAMTIAYPSQCAAAIRARSTPRGEK